MAKKKPNKKAKSQAEKWLSKARQSLSNCSRDFVLYDADGETVLYGPSTIYDVTNYANSKEPHWRTQKGWVVSKDVRDEKVSYSSSEDRCKECDPFELGHACECVSKKLPKAWRHPSVWKGRL